MKRVREASQYVWSGRSALSAPLSRWRHPVVGYIAACLCIAAGIGAILLLHLLVPAFYFPVSSLLLAILLVSLFWGIGPGLLAWLLGCVAFSYFAFRSPHEPSVPLLSWTILFRLLPFALAGLLTAVVNKVTSDQVLGRRVGSVRTEITEKHTGHMECLPLTH